MKLAHAWTQGADLEVHAWASSEGIVALRVGSVPGAGRVNGRPVEGVQIDRADSEALASLMESLATYLRGAPLRWGGPLDLRAVTDFQRVVFAAVQEIPHGEARTYRDVAEAIGRPKAGRAVGVALRRNPFPLVVPCHRVLRVGGELGGYLAGVGVKRRLLALEAGQTELRLPEAS